MEIIPKISLIVILVLVATFFANATFQVFIAANEKENESESTIPQESSLPIDYPLLGIGENERFDPESSIYYHSHDPSKMYDDFSNWPPWKENAEGAPSPNGNWVIAYKGGGIIDVMADNANSSNNVIVLEPEFVENETRAPLLLTSGKYTDFILSLDVRTDKQLRPENPNQWEMAWVLWRYVDETHFNYFTLKPNGTECGKYDGGINPIDQLFICDSPFPTTYIGKWDHWDIIVKGDQITILVNGKIVHDFEDVSSFDTGRIGLYNEDARTSFDNITIIPL